jgi:hypothetical protein
LSCQEEIRAVLKIGSFSSLSIRSRIILENPSCGLDFGAAADYPDWRRRPMIFKIVLGLAIGGVAGFGISFVFRHIGSS